ncbi:ester cyclase [Thalassomonas actiniarum]|uniref:Ester cyclase n=1 Tax=Thalassomonas actiniarum TaxID=485447 RepID=A0AAF0C474_9GAMM|nr:ester cyclase [Thalassomonas actiniarum]WDD99638.1 ester cyclase [Thalassomonas actiniarum]
MKMIKLLIPAFLLVSLFACNSDNDSKSPEVAGVDQPENPPQGPCVSVECQDSNQYAVEQIYTEIINGNNTQLVYSLYQEDFIQHNDAITAGLSGQQAYFNQLSSDNPDHVATIKHLVADGEYVAVHWHYSDTPENEFSGSAMVDLYKFSDGLISEQWNIAMLLGASTVSGNSVFSDLYVYQDAEVLMTEAMEDANKEMVTAFYLDLFNNQNIALIDELVDENYLQHNVWVPNGSAALRDFVSSRTLGGLEIFLSLAADDLVWTFSAGDNLTLVDLWRVDHDTGKIVEHWDLF